MLIDYLGDAPKVPGGHRFNLNNEMDNAGWFAYRLPDPNEGALPIQMWRECFNYIARRIHAVGHKVVLTGDGGWYRTQWPGGVQGWQWALGNNVLEYDIFACNFYWNDGSKGQRDYAIFQMKETAKIGKQLGKPVAYPEYGVAQQPQTVPDSEAIKFFNEVWDFMATLPATGAGRLDHHNVWSENAWALRPEVFKAFKARLGG